MGKTRTNPVTDTEIISAYEAGSSARKLAKQFGIGTTTIYRALHKSGAKIRGVDHYRREARRFDPRQDEALRKRYENGAGVGELVREFGGTFYSIRKAIVRAGGKLRPNPTPTEKPGELKRALALYKRGYSTMKVSIAIGRSQQFIIRMFRRHGIKMRRGQCGSKHGLWRGGRWKKEGYVLVLVDRNNPLASMRNHNGYILEHRLVMARHLGRPLKPYETVHHINGVRDDNRLENLQLRRGMHGNGVVLQCSDCGSCNIIEAELKDE